MTLGSSTVTHLSLIAMAEARRRDDAATTRVRCQPEWSSSSRLQELVNERLDGHSRS